MEQKKTSQESQESKPSRKQIFRSIGALVAGILLLIAFSVLMVYLGSLIR